LGKSIFYHWHNTCSFNVVSDSRLPKNVDPTQHPELPEESDISWNMRAWQRTRKLLIGGAKDLNDQGLFHTVALIPVLAWVGMGADGLSSSAYGPDESFRVLQNHLYLIPLVVLASMFTIFIISAAYSRVIEHFPNGGGGYVVASHLLGPTAGLVSGCALTVDYVLTITVSVAAGGDALFSLFPATWQHYKLGMELVCLMFLIIMNLRGIRESVLAVAPIFMLFVLTHILLIGCSFFVHWDQLSTVASSVPAGLQQGVASMGIFGLLFLFMKAYSMGAGTYTGIEAVSNGLSILRAPQVHTGKITMRYMAASLILASGGLFLGYLIAHVHVTGDQTMNAVLAEDVFGAKGVFGVSPISSILIWLTLASEAGLLVIAAQTGFIDGPRVMSNMSLDGWVPKRFSGLSDRLTMQNGVLVFGLASTAALLFTHGNVDILVVMYSINVFVTFSLTTLSMTRHFWRERRENPKWLGQIYIQVIGLVLCFSILVVMLVQKFAAGGWITVVVTTALIGVCVMVRRYYKGVAERLSHLDGQLMQLHVDQDPTEEAMDPSKPTAIILVDGYNGVGLHSLFSIFQIFFPGHFKNAVFVSVGVVDSGNFKGSDALEHLHTKVREDLERYVQFARRMGIPASYQMEMGIEVTAPAARLCSQIVKEFPVSVVFGSKFVFQKERWYQRWMHNQSVYNLQGRLQWEGIPMTVLPVRVFE
jgi:amino acid transporter